MDSVRVELPGESWAVLRDPEMVGMARRRELARSIADISPNVMALWGAKPGTPPEDLPDLTMDDYATIWAMNDQLVVTLVEQWSFDFPVSREALEADPPNGVTAAQHDALIAACGPLVPKLLPDFELRLDPVTKKPDPADPTNPSAGSAPRGGGSRTGNGTSRTRSSQKRGTTSRSGS